VIRHIANGGMASVWECEDDLLGRHVAVKVLAPHLAEDPAAVSRFQREARAAARVSSHPHVVTIYDVGEHDGCPFIVMELFTGGSVARWLRGGRRPSIEQGLVWLRDAGEALDTAHDHDLIHRDIKPGNLLLDERNRLAVADFGIARLARDQTVTTSGEVLGTAAYLSPEQACGKGATPASDRYALAVVAFELLTGRRPFQAEHFAAQARQHIDEAPPLPSDVLPSLPPEVDAVIGRGLAKNPGQRWPTCGAMVRALEHALQGARDQTGVTRPLTRSTRRAGPAAAAGALGAASGANGHDGAAAAPSPPLRRRGSLAARRGAPAAAAAAAAAPSVPRAPRTPTPAPPPSEPRRPRTPTPPPGPPPAGRGSSPGGRRRPWAWAVAALAALAVAAGVIALASSGGEDPGRSTSSASSDRSDQAAQARSERRAERRRRRAAAQRRQERRRQQQEQQQQGQPAPAPSSSGQGQDGAGAGAGSSGGGSGQGGGEVPGAGGSQDIGTAARYNDQGFAKLQAGDAQGAIDPLERAVKACGGEPDPTSPCAYAMFNLGKALNDAGRGDEAVAILEKRLENPDQRDKVQAELDRAKRG